MRDPPQRSRLHLPNVQNAAHAVRLRGRQRSGTAVTASVSARNVEASKNAIIDRKHWPEGISDQPGPTHAGTRDAEGHEEEGQIVGPHHRRRHHETPIMIEKTARSPFVRRRTATATPESTSRCDDADHEASASPETSQDSAAGRNRCPVRRPFPGDEADRGSRASRRSRWLPRSAALTQGRRRGPRTLLAAGASGRARRQAAPGGA